MLDLLPVRSRAAWCRAGMRYPGRAIVYTRGRVVGGSSSINGLIYIRGQPEDYDHWGQLGNRGWSWDDCLPYFRQAERWEGQESDVRGKQGPLFTSRIDRLPICG